MTILKFDNIIKEFNTLDIEDKEFLIKLLERISIEEKIKYIQKRVIEVHEAFRNNECFVIQPDQPISGIWSL